MTRNNHGSGKGFQALDPKLMPTPIMEQGPTKMGVDPGPIRPQLWAVTKLSVTAGPGQAASPGIFNQIFPSLSVSH